MSGESSRRPYNVVHLAANAEEVVVKVEVPSYAALLAYEPVRNEKTIVIPRASCSREDLEAIRAHIATNNNMTIEEAVGGTGDTNAEADSEAEVEASTSHAPEENGGSHCHDGRV